MQRFLISLAFVLSLLVAGLNPATASAGWHGHGWHGHGWYGRGWHRGWGWGPRWRWGAPVRRCWWRNGRRWCRW